jgi:hypothetical protein
MDSQSSFSHSRAFQQDWDFLDRVRTHTATVQKNWILRDEALLLMRSRKLDAYPVENVGHHSLQMANSQPPRNGCSPIEALPEELLVEIFKYMADWNHFSCTYKFAPANFLGHVSSKWRRLSLAMPCLWSKIALVLQHDHLACDPKLFVHAIETLCKRSKAQLLDIKLDMNCKRAIHPALEALWNSCSRWRTLWINDNGSQIEYPESSPGSHSTLFPSLEMANINLCDDEMQVSILGSPRMSHAVISGRDWHMTDAFTARTFTHLKYVELNMADWQSPLAMLPNVELLVLHLDYTLRNTGAVSLPTSCRYLLLDCIVNNKNISAILSCIHVPSLQYLKLRTKETGHARRAQKVPVDALKLFFSRTRKLQGFAMQHFAAPDLQVDDIVSALAMKEPHITVAEFDRDHQLIHLIVRDIELQDSATQAELLEMDGRLRYPGQSSLSLMH